MNANDVVRLRHMLDEAKRAERFMADKSKVALDSDEQLSYAVRYALQIVGEAASKVSAETRTAYPEIAWTAVIGMRQWLVHGYERVINAIVWQTVTQDVPILIDQLESILAQLPPVNDE